MYLKVEAEKCTGCRICESFCSFHHERAIWPGRSRITILADSDEGPFTPSICRQCGALEGETAPCAEACPGAVFRMLSGSVCAAYLCLTEPVPFTLASTSGFPMYSIVPGPFTVAVNRSLTRTTAEPVPLTRTTAVRLESPSA